MVLVTRHKFLPSGTLLLIERPVIAQYIASKPPRLYCPTCADTYPLPPNISPKIYHELTCPLDGFEIVLLSHRDKTVPACPACYVAPPFDPSDIGAMINHRPLPAGLEAANGQVWRDMGECRWD